MGSEMCIRDRYVGVQTLENSGVDRRVDLIQTEAGMEWRMPEAHAVWK